MKKYLVNEVIEYVKMRDERVIELESQLDLLKWQINILKKKGDVAVCSCCHYISMYEDDEIIQCDTCEKYFCSWASYLESKCDASAPHNILNDTNCGIGLCSVCDTNYCDDCDKLIYCNGNGDECDELICKYCYALKYPNEKRKYIACNQCGDDMQICDPCYSKWENDKKECYVVNCLGKLNK
jgi:hypothetical protein